MGLIYRGRHFTCDAAPSRDQVPIMRLVGAVRGESAAEPYAHHAERALLGALLIDNQAFDRVADLVSAEDFYCDDHRRIWRHIARLIEASRLADVVTVTESIEASEDKDKTGGPAYLAALAQNTPGSVNVRNYGELVREHALKRKVAAAARAVAERAEGCGEVGQLARDFEEVVRSIGTPNASSFPRALDLAALAKREPHSPRHIIEEWLPAGEVTLLAGHGGSGKSQIALALSVCISLGLPWHGIATARRRVCYVAAEDNADVIHWRLARRCAHLGVALAELAGRLEVFDVSHLDAELMIDRGPGENPVITDMYHALRERVQRDMVLVLDGASDLYGGSEIVRRHVRRFIRALRCLIGSEGAVLLLAHVDKAAARNKAAGDRYSGSTAWHNSVRSRLEVSAEPNGDVSLTLAKANYGRGGAKIRLRWDAEAHLYIAEQAAAEGGTVEAIGARDECEGILAAMRACAAVGIPVPAATQGPRTAYHVLKAQPTFPASLCADTVAARRRFWAAVEKLRVLRAIEEREIRASHHHTVRTLVLGPGAS